MAFIDIPAERDMENLGVSLADRMKPGSVLFFSGDLGAGKTTLIRGVLRGLGYDGPVTSPTYTLVEPYNLQDIPIFHFDLYRLKNPQELEMIGIRDMLGPESICFIEWPDRGVGVLPEPDYEIHIRYEGDSRQVEIVCPKLLEPLS